MPIRASLSTIGLSGGCFALGPHYPLPSHLAHNSHLNRLAPHVPTRPLTPDHHSYATTTPTATPIA